MQCGSRLLPALAALAAAGAVGQEPLEAPEPLEQPRPPAATRPDGRPTEGWAVVRYSVLADGSPANVRVIGIAPPDLDPGPAIDTVGRWTFRPATDAAGPIDWHNNESVVVFELPDSRSPPPESFRTTYLAVNEALTASTPPPGETADAGATLEAYDEALALNRELLANEAQTVEEIALALSQAALIRLGRRDTHQAYELARLVTVPQIQPLEEIDFFLALAVRLQLETELGRTRDALATYERIDAGYGPEETNPSEQAAALLRQSWRDEEILAAEGRVGERPWRFDAGRRIFSIARVDGELGSIDAECDTRRLTLEFQPDVEWELPAALGECTLFVGGDPGTTFTFYEMLPAQAE